MKYLAQLGLWFILIGNMALMRPQTCRAQNVHPSADVAGTWQGTLHSAQGKELKLIVIVSHDGSSLNTKLYVLDKRTPELLADESSLSDGTFTFNIGVASMSYSGNVSTDGTIVGSLRQGETDTLLTWTRATPETAWDIPEMPKLTTLDPSVDPEFEVALIKPARLDERSMNYKLSPKGNFTMTNMNVPEMMMLAFDLHKDQILQTPSWAEDQHFDVEAASNIPGLPNMQQLKSEVRKLLIDRFGLRVHDEQRPLVAYNVTVAKGGLKIRPKASVSGFNGLPQFDFIGTGKIQVANCSIQEFANFMQSLILDRPMVDHTGLGEQKFSFTLEWQMDEDQAARMGLPKPAISADGPRLTIAMPQQLGLDVGIRKTAVHVVIVDHLEKPSAN